MFCMSCGQVLPDEARFCYRCGFEMWRYVSQEEEPCEEVEEPQDQEIIPSEPEPPAASAPQEPFEFRVTPMRIVASPYGSRSEIYAFVPVESMARVVANAEAVLHANGFQLIPYDNEQVWKKGTGAVTAMQFVKLLTAPGCLLIQGWLQTGVGGAGFGEVDLEGVSGMITKSSLRKVINQIIASIRM